MSTLETSPAGAETIAIAGETLALLPERAVHWPARRTLFVADVHLGKAAAFRAGGVPVPRGTTDETLERLTRALRRSGATRVVVLGDLLHARSGRAPETLERMARWREEWPALELVLVRGNHDRGAGDPPDGLGVVCVDAPHREAPFVFAHHPAIAADGYVLAGHVHPGVRLRGAAGLRERLPCFWFSEAVAVLPAFGAFTGLADVEPAEADRVFVLAGEQVLPVAARATAADRSG